MIILVAGATHTGKTIYAQRLLEAYHFPCFSIDHLKMGLIRSGQTALTPMDDDKLTDYLWPIVREIVKTAIENKQNLIIEGCYIPFCWRKDFAPAYLKHIRYVCLIMSRRYMQAHWEDILTHASDLEQRLDDSGLSMEDLLAENEENLAACIAHGLDYILIDDRYSLPLPGKSTDAPLAERVYAFLQTVPAGKVVTYGQIAQRLGNKHLAQAVGNALHSNPDPSRYPCHRVVNSRGCLAEHYAFGGKAAQKAKLEAEGIVFSGDDTVDLAKYSWKEVTL